MKKFIPIVALFCTSCTTALDFTPTMASDPPVLGIEGSAFAADLSRAYQPLPDDEKAICSNLQLGYQEQQSYSVKRYRPGTKAQVEAFKCVGFKRNPDPKDVAAHVKTGFALSDYYCSIFFDRISEHASKRKFARNGVNDVGAMVSTVLGLAAAGSGITGGVSAGFALADGSFRNYDENFLVSADLPTLRRYVLSEQKKYRAQLVMPDNYADATSAILEYANLCSFEGMKGLLVNSMDAKTRVNDDDTKKALEVKAKP